MQFSLVAAARLRNSAAPIWLGPCTTLRPLTFAPLPQDYRAVSKFVEHLTDVTNQLLTEPESREHYRTLRPLVVHICNIHWRLIIIVHYVVQCVIVLIVSILHLQNISSFTILAMVIAFRSRSGKISNHLVNPSRIVNKYLKPRLAFKGPTTSEQNNSF